MIITREVSCLVLNYNSIASSSHCAQPNMVVTTSLNIKTHTIASLNLMSLSMTTHSLMTLSIKTLCIKAHKDTQHNDTQYS